MRVEPSLRVEEEEERRGVREELYTSKRLSSVRVTVIRISSRAMNSKGIRGSIHSSYSLSWSLRPKRLRSRMVDSKSDAISRTVGPAEGRGGRAVDGSVEGKEDEE